MAKYGISGRPWCTHCGAYVDQVDDDEMCERCVELDVYTTTARAEVALEAVDAAVKQALVWAHGEDILARVTGAVEQDLSDGEHVGQLRLDALYDRQRAMADAREGRER